MVRAELVVLGVGNTLLSDEGFGIHVVRELERQGVPDGVEVVEGGVSGFALLDVFEGVSKAIIIDAADMGVAPGSLRRFTPDQVVRVGSGSGFSLHQVGLLEVLELASALGQDTEAVIIGVQPETMEPGEDLSPTVQGNVAEAVELVRAEIEEHFVERLTREKGA